MLVLNPYPSRESFVVLRIRPRVADEYVYLLYAQSLSFACCPSSVLVSRVIPYVISVSDNGLISRFGRLRGSAAIAFRPFRPIWKPGLPGSGLFRPVRGVRRAGFGLFPALAGLSGHSSTAELAQSVHIADHVHKRDRRRGARHSDHANPQPHAVLLVAKDMLDFRPNRQFAPVGLGDPLAHGGSCYNGKQGVQHGTAALAPQPA